MSYDEFDAHGEGQSRSGGLLVLVPSLPSVGGGPDFGAGGNDAAMLGVGELQVQDIAAQLNPAP